ncbi:hypothetical protein [Bradyrhizobium sp. JR3.5]
MTSLSRNFAPAGICFKEHVSGADRDPITPDVVLLGGIRLHVGGKLAGNPRRNFERLSGNRHA